MKKMMMQLFLSFSLTPFLFAGGSSEQSSLIDTQASGGDTQTNTADDQLILVGGGTFLMGSPPEERQRDEDEVLHEVEISSFYVDPWEVTQRDYERVMGENPSFFKGESLPVESVTWFDAVTYCNKLSELENLEPVYTIDGESVRWNRNAEGYRLLTEAEWEYVARAGTDTIFNAGTHLHSDVVNFHGSYPYLIEENYVRRQNPEVITSRYRGTPLEVGSLPANQYGLYDTHGNVSEWCFDYYGPYDTTQPKNPAGSLSGSLRVNRGGSYNDFAKHVRNAYRSATNPIDPDQNLGFRIARNATGIDEVVTTTYALDITVPENPRILVAYFSHTGNTENAARIIRDKTGADLFEVEPATPYRGNIYDVSQEELNKDVRPTLSAHVANMAQYDVILLGYPTWWATIPMPMVTFLEAYDFAGKSIFSFSSHGGTMFGDSVSDLSKHLPESYVGQGLCFSYSGGRDLEQTISSWLHLNGIRER
ncbi:MAG: flavodoxin [Sphaerochaetaceae bacterium]